MLNTYMEENVPLDTPPIQDANEVSVPKARRFHWSGRFALIGFTVVLVGLMGVMLFAVQKQQDIRNRATGGNATLTLIPASPTVNQGIEFTEAITVNTHDQTMSAAEVHLSYDPAKLQAVKIEAGTFLPVTLTAGAVGNGAASITLGSQPTEPKKGSGVLASVTFKLLTNATADIAFTNATQIAAVGRTDNAVGTKTGAQVSPAGGTPTPPTPTPTDVPPGDPTPTPTPTSTPIPTATPTPQDQSGQIPPATTPAVQFGSLRVNPTPTPASRITQAPTVPLVEEIPAESFPTVPEEVTPPTDTGFLAALRNFFVNLFGGLFGRNR